MPSTCYTTPSSKEVIIPLVYYDVDDGDGYIKVTMHQARAIARAILQSDMKPGLHSLGAWRTRAQRKGMHSFASPRSLLEIEIYLIGIGTDIKHRFTAIVE